jgi:hypothetical protein
MVQRQQSATLKYNILRALEGLTVNTTFGKLSLFDN